MDSGRWTPEILECRAVTGESSHLLEIRTRSTSSLEDHLAEIQSWAGVHWTTTGVVLSVGKETPRSELEGSSSQKAE